MKTVVLRLPIPTPTSARSGSIKQEKSIPSLLVLHSQGRGLLLLRVLLNQQVQPDSRSISLNSTVRQSAVVNVSQCVQYLTLNHSVKKSTCRKKNIKNLKQTKNHPKKKFVLISMCVFYFSLGPFQRRNSFSSRQLSRDIPS